MEKLNKFIIDHTKSLHPFLDSISLKNIDFNSALQNISIRVGDMTDKFPITMEMLKRGLRLR